MKYLLAILFASITLFGGFMFGLKMGYREPVLLSTPIPYTYPVASYPTGRQVLDELNRYRASQDLPEFEITEYLCDNIAKRWVNYVENDSHEGLHEFLSEQHPGETWSVSEILAPGATARETVQNWVDSPSHEQYITGNSKACVYSAEGRSVALLSN